MARYEDKILVAAEAAIYLPLEIRVEIRTDFARKFSRDIELKNKTAETTTRILDDYIP